MDLTPEYLKKNKLLERLKNNQLTMDKFMEECFLWSLEPQVWQDIGVLSYPTPPKEWLEYEGLSLIHRSKVGEEFFHQMPIKEYLSAKSKVYAHNYGHWDWLKQMKAFFPEEGNTELHKQVDEKLNDFNEFFTGSTGQIDRVRQMFNAEDKNG